MKGDKDVEAFKKGCQLPLFFNTWRRNWHCKEGVIANRKPIRTSTRIAIKLHVSMPHSCLEKVLQVHSVDAFICSENCVQW